MEEEEIWVVVPSFGRYAVSSFGRVRNTDSGRMMILSPTQFGELTVGMTKGRREYRRSVKVLVARAFVEGENEVDNTPILLDGDRTNLHHSNILWRPRWLAWKYTRQFENPPIWYQHGPIEDRFGNRYATIIQAATTLGSLASDVMYSIRTGRKVFPGGETFTFVKRK